jgi:flagellar motor protein MotB
MKKISPNSIKNSLKSMTTFSMIAVLSCTMAACSLPSKAKRPDPIITPNDPMQDTGSNLIYCKPHMNCHASLSAALCCSNVSMFAQGDKLRLVLPSGEFFNDDNMSQVRLDRLYVLKKISHMLVRTYPGAPITITGYTSNIPAPKQQLDESQQKADAVAAYMWNNGVANDRVTVKAKGEKDPISVNDTLHGREANNRVEIKVSLPQ